MLAHAADLDPVAAVGNAVEYARLRIELLAQLIEVGDLETSAEPDGSRIGLQLAEEEAEERRLSRSIRPDESNAIAARDRRREVPHDQPITVRERHALRLGHQPARSL